MFVLSLSFLNDNTKGLSTPCKSESIRWSKYLFTAFIYTFYLHLFQLINCINSGFNCCNSFVLSWLDRFVAETSSFVSSTINLSATVKLEITQFPDRVRIRLILQKSFYYYIYPRVSFKNVRCRVVVLSKKVMIF